MHQPIGYRSGIGIVLVNRQGLVFAGRRRDGRVPPWQMPQGGLEPDETPDSAVLRELAEELGTAKASIIDSTRDWIHYDYPDGMQSRRARHFRGQRHKWFLLRFTGKDHEIAITTPHAEFDDWRWLPPADLIEQVIAFKQPVYRHVFERLSPVIRHLGSSSSSGGSAIEATEPAWLAGQA